MMLENSFLNYVNYECHEKFSCDVSGCYEEGICRCSIIEEVKIKDIKIRELTQSIYFSLNKSNTQKTRDIKLVSLIWGYDYSLINKWCIDRILTINRVFDSDNWTFMIQGGYYGQEVEDFCLKEELYRKIEFQLEEVSNLEALEEKVKYLLKLEYGNLLDSLDKKNFSLEKVDYKKIIFPNQSYRQKVLSQSNLHYKDYNFPRAVVVQSGEYYRVIDGYHRLSASKRKKTLVIVAK